MAENKHKDVLTVTPDNVASENPLSQPPQRGRWHLDKGKLLLPVLFVVSVACIFALNLRAGLEQISAGQPPAEPELDAAFAGLANGSASGGKRHTAEQLANTFRCEVSQRQVPPEKLRGNAFVFVWPGQMAHTQPTAPPPQADDTGQDSEAVPEEAMAAVRKLHLQAILVGSGGVTAIISNNLLTEGQEIHGWKVSKIHPKDAVLTWGNYTYVIKLAR